VVRSIYMQNTFLRLILTFVRNVSRIITVTLSLEWLLNSRLQRNNLLLQIERPRSTIRVVRESIGIKGSAVDLEKKESAPVRAVIKNTIFIWKKKRITVPICNFGSTHSSHKKILLNSFSIRLKSQAC